MMFGALLEFTQAALACNRQAREFVDQFGEVPEFSRFSTVPGKPYCQPAASLQAKDRFDAATQCINRLVQVMGQWVHTAGALDSVARGVSISLPTIVVDGRSYQTAHEGAYYFAQAVVDRFRRVEGYSDLECVQDLAERLSDLQAAPDLHGRIEGEYYAAEALAPSPALPEAEGATVNARMIDKLKTTPEAANWTAEAWADVLNCAKSTIIGTATWKALMHQRAGLRLDRGGKPRDRRRGRK